ncbi:hypothetical protein [Streptomyces sp. OE57]|uniref:hypothetical protein n=1 Tax=Streptomyces lacaronensis TaxID=3379885 RepID=UPI0039B72AEC
MTTSLNTEVSGAVRDAMAALDVLFAVTPNPDLPRKDMRKFVDEAAARIKAIRAFNALVTEEDITVVEWPMVTFNEKVRSGFRAHYLEKDGVRPLIVPKNQAPTERLHAARQLLTHQGVTARRTLRAEPSAA